MKRLVVFDAAGTLLEMAGSVGEAYAEDARAAGAELDAATVGQAFGRALAAAPPLAFGELDPESRRIAERGWWRRVARAALGDTVAGSAGFSFESFFDRAWDRFARPAAWRVPGDVRPALRELRSGGHPLAVLSNWDARLRGVLAGSGLGGFFCRVVVSSELPAAKPAVEAFTAARHRLGELAGASPPLMVGDRLDHDVEPALAAGWDAVWLDRAGKGGAPAGVRPARSLAEIATDPG